MDTRTGRTIDAVLNPKNYPPFPTITNQEQFNQVWVKNPMWIFANMAHAAYCDPDEIKTALAGFGAETRFYQSTADENGITRGRQALLSIWSDKAIVAFRGTEGSETMKIQPPEFIRSAMNMIGITLPQEVSTFLATDIIDDLDFIKVPYKNSEVHRGFFSATSELWPAIKKDLTQLNLSVPEQVFATGHSLGAAMAVIAGMAYPFANIVTFGEPRVGNAIGESLQRPDSHIRYVNGNDPITKVVPTMFPFCYEHHGELREIADNAYGGPNALYDHSIVNYAEILHDPDDGHHSQTA